MTRRWQLFAAPGDEDEPLSAEPSPWLDGRWARVPLADWATILDFAGSQDEAAGDRLWFQSGRNGLAGEDVIRFDADAISGSIAFLDRVASALETADPLVPEPTDDQPEAYPNEELARMVRAVRAVMAESLRTGEPFRAWNE